MIVFRSDSSNMIGSGHIMRCLRIAKKFKKLGKKCLFVCSDYNNSLKKKIEQCGFEVKLIKKPKKTFFKAHKNNLAHSHWLASTQEYDAEKTINIISKYRIEWLIIDHYGIDHIWEKKLRPYVKKIMIIDDLADRIHDCDLLLDQNLVYNFKKRYKNLVPNKCNLLLGSRYALLDSRYSKLREKYFLRNGKIKRIVVFFGGADQNNYTQLAVTAILNLKMKDIFFDIVMSKESIFFQQIKKIIKNEKKIKIHDSIPNLANLIFKADLAIGAAGSNTWERCCLGLPSIIISSGINQIKIAESMNKNGAAIVISTKVDLQKEIMKSFLFLYQNKKAYLKMSKKALSICDGKGIKRLFSKLI